MEKDRERELTNAGIRKREEELARKRRKRVKKLLGCLCLIILFGAGAYVSKMAYDYLVESESQTLVAVDSMFLEPVEEVPSREDAAEELPEAEQGSEMDSETDESGNMQETEQGNEPNTEEQSAVAESTEDVTVETDALQKAESEKEDAEDEDALEEKADAKDEADKNTDSEQAEYLCISTINVNLRSEPSASAAIVGKILPKTVVTVLEHDDAGWYHVKYNGMEGYVIDKALREQ